MKRAEIDRTYNRNLLGKLGILVIIFGKSLQHGGLALRRHALFAACAEQCGDSETNVGNAHERKREGIQGMSASDRRSSSSLHVQPCLES